MPLARQAFGTFSVVLPAVIASYYLIQTRATRTDCRHLDIKLRAEGSARAETIA